VAPKPTPRIGKSERTRAAILDAALEFIWSHPFRDMTVNAVMTSAGLSRSAFYQYFRDLHDLMETLLDMLKDEVYAVAGPWFEGVGDPVALLNESLTGVVEVCYRLGPILRAADDASATDEKFENAWRQFIEQFDDAVVARIEADQAQGLIPNFDARPVAISLNRLDVYTLSQAFGHRPKSKPEPVREALARIWISTLYGSKWLENKGSNLART
jgi:AcrR family transcriptional regulator